MKGVVSYLASDGEVHVYDVAQRQVPLCGKEGAWLDRPASESKALACEECCTILFDAVEEEVK